jgi:tetratricopeptide (TPR) repeat protein
MFSNTDYYLDKYDMMTGNKDDTKEFIRYTAGNAFSMNVIHFAEETNLYEVETLNRIDKILNDVPFSKKEMCDEIEIIKEVLIDTKLLEFKGGQYEATKKGRAVSRLSIEERYAALLFLFIYNANWDRIMTKIFNEKVEVDIQCIFKIFSTIFSKNMEVHIKLEDIHKINEKELLLEIASLGFRIAKAEALQYGSVIIDICLLGFGLIDIQNSNFSEIAYKANNFSQSVFKVMLKDFTWNMKTDIESIGKLIKSKKYDKAEQSIMDYISNYGDNIIVWDYWGQILLLKKDYENAYIVLKHAYEVSSKKGRGAKTALYHLVLCCRKLKLFDDIESYEQKLQGFE